MTNFDFKPLVTVVIPVYNAGEYLRVSVESIINQTYGNLEIIIIDDGSTDDCLSTIADLIDNRINIVHQVNGGKSSAMNNALDMAKGEYYIIQDADDISKPERVEKQLEYLIEHKDLAAVFIGHDILIKEIIFAPTFRVKSPEECKLGIDKFIMPAHDATGMYRLSMVNEFRFNTDLRIGQGVDYILRIGEIFPTAQLGECLYTYRINYESEIRKDPSKTIEYINKVRELACQRRDVKFEPMFFDISKKLGFDTHIIPHSMESIVQLKGIGKFFSAIRVGGICISLNVKDFRYYKPFVYSLVPLFLINCYRRLKVN